MKRLSTLIRSTPSSDHRTSCRQRAVLARASGTCWSRERLREINPHWQVRHLSIPSAQGDSLTAPHNQPSTFQWIRTIRLGSICPFILPCLPTLQATLLEEACADL